METLDYLARCREKAFNVYPDNSAIECMHRSNGIHIHKTNLIEGGPGTITIPYAKFTGSIILLNHYANIESVTTLTNCTDVYTDVYDGTIAEKVTAGNPGGADLSGFLSGSVIVKTEDETQPITAINSDQVRVYEADRKYVARPYTVVAKEGLECYLRFHLTTTDSPLSAIITIHLEYRIVFDGSTLELL